MDGCHHCGVHLDGPRPDSFKPITSPDPTHHQTYSTSLLLVLPDPRVVRYGQPLLVTCSSLLPLVRTLSQDPPCTPTPLSSTSSVLDGLTTTSDSWMSPPVPLLRSPRPPTSHPSPRPFCSFLRTPPPSTPGTTFINDSPDAPVLSLHWYPSSVSLRGPLTCVSPVGS